MSDNHPEPFNALADPAVARVADKTIWRIPLFELLSCLTDVLDWISPQVVRHHKEVAFLALCIAEELGWSKTQKQQVVMAGLLHDIGALSLKDRLDTLTFEMTTGPDHAEHGFLLLETYAPFAEVARIVRYHHQPWQNGGGVHAVRSSGTVGRREAVPLASHLLHLADRIAIRVDHKTEILGQVESIRGTVGTCTGELFHPELAAAFQRRSVQEAMWFDLVSSSLDRMLQARSQLPTLEIDIDGLSELAGLFRRIIDFRSPFTATHSSGVAITASSLASAMGFPPAICRMMWVAGYLHDLGKLGVPSEILDKPDKLTPEETRIVRRHPFDTLRCLETIEDLREIALWGALHHERIDGSGYPFHLRGDELSLPVRIMAVADVFTAITEDRPYRGGMSSPEARRILESMAGRGVLDPAVVNVLLREFAFLDRERRRVQETSIQEYKTFVANFGRGPNPSGEHP